MSENSILHATKSKWKMPLFVFFKDARLVFKLDSLGKEILGIAFPAALAVAADPIASLIDTAFIGHLGPVELAAAGVSIALFNQASRITIFPLVSITTSFVAEEDTIGKVQEAEKSLTVSRTKSREAILPEDDDSLQDLEKGSFKDSTESLGKSSSENSDMKDFSMQKNSALDNMGTDAAGKNDTNCTDTNSNKCKSSSVVSDSRSKANTGIKKRRNIASASTALLFGTILGLLQAVTLICAAKPLLGVMGLKHDSPMLVPAIKYLRLRSLGAPAVLLCLAMQGIFRGFKDTKTPLYVIVLGYAVNITLDPLLIFKCKLGLRGAAIAHVLSQYMMAVVLFLILMKKVNLLPPSIKDLQIFRFLKNGGLLLARVVAVTFCVTLAASLAARLGSIPMAAFQTCLQVWLTSSLLADGLAVAVQAILACSFAEKDYGKATSVATRVLQMGFVLGLGLSLLVGVGLYFGAGIFSQNVDVLHLIKIGLPFIAATQPINSLAFVFDGVNFGASDFAYSAYSLVMVSIASVISLLLLCKSNGFIGIWIALTIYMSLRMFAGIWRMATGTGPWHFLRRRSLP
ncbi:protein DETOXIFICATION 43-like isoform X2 [Neltuma alba]|uniref:protein DETOXIFICATION 43-like isoform X2 n=1 Tax=Neltuma alba TaxID=207710 RepID=UPI0010A3B166|nr:protein DETOXIFICATION 43-like isoform X2 [Prosopis alba]